MSIENNPTQNQVVKAIKNLESGKQDTISDLSTIRSGASAGATAVQPSTLNSYIPFGQALLSTNPFGGKKLYISKIDNAFYNAYERFTVTGSYTDGTTTTSYDANALKRLFNGNYDNHTSVPAGCTATIRITFDNDNGHEGELYNGYYSYPFYAQGYIYISYYYTFGAKSATTGKTYTTYPTSSVGEKSFTSTIFNGAYASSNLIERALISSERMAWIEFVITAPDSKQALITQIDFQPSRPSPSINPFINKYSEEKLYETLNSSNVIPRLNETYDLGSSAKQYNNIYAKNINEDGTSLSTKYQSKITSSNKLDYSLIDNQPTIPTKTSDLTNDSNFAVDASYVHTDNNFTSTEKTKLSNAVVKNASDTQTLDSSIAVSSSGFTGKLSSTDVNFNEGTTDTFEASLMTVTTTNGGVDNVIGVKGTGGDLSSIFIGGTSASPNISITNAGQTTFKSTPKVGSTNVVLSTDLSTVATSGSYNDLSNKPTIPTVNNATIKINQGSQEKGSFTLNQSGDTTITLDAGSSGGSAFSRGTCPTANGVFPKIISASDFELIEGAIIEVTFTYSQTGSSGEATFNVNSTGNVSCYRKSSIGVETPYWDDGDTVRFEYHVVGGYGGWYQQTMYNLSGVPYSYASNFALNAYTLQNLTLQSSASATTTFNGSTARTLSNYYTDKFTDQSIAGTKNFTGTLQEGGVNVATVDDVPTKTSDLTNDSGFITSSSLPTVNNATLTIQKNGTTVNTFTANSSSNVTANITVPTKTSEITNDSGFLTAHQDISGKANTNLLNVSAGLTTGSLGGSGASYYFGTATYWRLVTVWAYETAQRGDIKLYIASSAGASGTLIGEVSGENGYWQKQDLCVSGLIPPGYYVYATYSKVETPYYSESRMGG